MRKKLPMFYSALLLTGVNLLLRLVGTGFQVYLSGRIGAAGIGLLQLVMSVAGLSMTAGIAGVRTAAMYLTAEELGHKHPENVCFILSGCFMYSVLCSSAVSALLLHFSRPIAEQWIGDIRAEDAVRLLAWFLPVSCLCSVMTGYFTAAGRIGTLAAVETGEQIFSIATTLLALQLYAGSDPGRACTSVILGSSAGTCFTLLLLLILRLNSAPASGAPIPVRSRLLETAVPLALADNLKAGISTAENLMVPRRLSRFPGVSNPMALYGMICGMVFPVMMFPSAILFGLTELLIPELARCSAADSRKRIRYLALRSLHTAMLFGFFCSGLLIVMSDFLCTSLYHSTAAASDLRRFSILVPMLYCDFITDSMTKGLGQQKICVRNNILTSSLDVLLLFLLLPKYGISGYFFSFLLTHLLNFLLSIRLLLKITGIRLKCSIPLRTACSAAAGIFAGMLLQGPVLKAAGFISVFGCLLVLCSIVSMDDLRWLRGLVQKK